MTLEQPYDYTQEDHAREVERALMYIAQAQRKSAEIASALAKGGAEERLVIALRTAASALRAEHNRLLNRTHFPVPDDLPESREVPTGTADRQLGEVGAGPEPESTGADQGRLAI